jgi:hypothetical protein
MRAVWDRFRSGGQVTPPGNIPPADAEEIIRCIWTAEWECEITADRARHLERQVRKVQEVWT